MRRRIGAGTCLRTLAYAARASCETTGDQIGIVIARIRRMRIVLTEGADRAAARLGAWKPDAMGARHAVAVATFAALALSLAVGPASACTCREMPTLAEAVARAAVVVEGRIVGVDYEWPESRAQNWGAYVLARYTVRADRVWKGLEHLDGEHRVVLENELSTCALLWPLREPLVLFGYPHGQGRLHLPSVCDRTVDVSQAGALGEPVAAPGPHPPSAAERLVTGGRWTTPAAAGKEPAFELQVWPYAEFQLVRRQDGQLRREQGLLALRGAELELSFIWPREPRYGTGLTTRVTFDGDSATFTEAAQLTDGLTDAATITLFSEVRTGVEATSWGQAKLRRSRSPVKQGGRCATTESITRD